MRGLEAYALGDNAPGFFHCRFKLCGIIVAAFIIAAHVTRLHRTELFHIQRLQNHALHVIAATGVDGMGDVRMQLETTDRIALTAPLIEAGTALVAVMRPQVILATATRTTVGNLAARHGKKWTIATLNDFQVTNDETIVKRD